MPLVRNSLLACLTVVFVFACSSGQSPGPIETRSRNLGLAPVIGSETRIDEPVYTEQAGEQSQPFIAAGGPGALVVWRDDSRPDFASSQRPVSFARLDAEGNLLDPVPIPITPPAADFHPWLPVAGWNGDRALVFWGNSVASGLELRGSRLTKEGAVLDPGTLASPGGIAIALGEGMRTPVAVVPFESDFLVFWQGDQPRMARVGNDGSVATLGGHPIAFPADGVARTLVGAVAVTGGILVMVSENSQIKVMKVDATGAALSALSEAAGPANMVKSGIASSGSGALVCWAQAAASGQPVTLLGRHGGADGAWSDAASFEVRAAGAEVGQVGVVWNGSGYVCTWTEAGTRVHATLRAIPASGAPVAAAVGPLTLATAPVLSVDLVWTGNRYLAAMARTSAPWGMRADPRSCGHLFCSFSFADAADTAWSLEGCRRRPGLTAVPAMVEVRMGQLVKGMGRVVPAAVVNATEEAARIRARAEEEASALRSGAQQEIEAAKQAGLAAGREEGLAELSALLLAARARDEQELASKKDTAIALARRMAEKIVGRAIDSSPELMNQIVADALAASRTRSGKIVLRVHPEDLASIEAGRPQWATRVEAAVHVRLQPDATVEHGGCVVDTPSGRVDARLQRQLDALERALCAAAGKEKA